MYGNLRGIRRAASGTISPIIRNTSTPALEIQNTHTSGDALSILDASGTQFVKIGRYSGGRSALSFGDISGILNPSVFFWVNRNMTDHGSGFESSVSTNGTDSIDIGASLFVSRMDNTGAVSHGRAIEGHHFRLPGSSAGENYIAELGRHCSVANALATGDVGVRISNEHTNWDPPISSGTTGGYGVLVRGEDEWQYGYGLFDASENPLWHVYGATGGGHTAGDMHTGNIIPIADSASVLGNASFQWLVTISDFITLTATAGGESAPNLVFSGDGDTGLWRPGADTLAWSTNALERLRIDANGNVSVGKAALVTTATDGFLYIPSSAGAPTGVPTAKTGLVPLHFDSTNSKFYVYSGSWKGVTVS